jgi:hypothetical protein
MIANHIKHFNICLFVIHLKVSSASLISLTVNRVSVTEVSSYIIKRPLPAIPLISRNT